MHNFKGHDFRYNNNNKILPTRSVYGFPSTLCKNLFFKEFGLFLPNRDGANVQFNFEITIKLQNLIEMKISTKARNTMTDR